MTNESGVMPPTASRTTSPEVSPAPPSIDNEKIAMRASILIVLDRLRTQNTFNPSLMVIRQCIRELSRYERLADDPRGDSGHHEAMQDIKAGF